MMRHNNIWFIIFTVIMGASGCSKNRTQDKVEKLIRDHLQLRPRMQVQDVYKLLYQRHMGAGHLITDTAKARQYLLKEMEAVATQPNRPEENLVERIAEDSSVVRINLYPFIKINGSADQLFTALLESVAQTTPNIKALRSDWEWFVRHSAGLGFEPMVVDSFHSQVVSMNYPMIHHSDRYTMHYRPAYRILLYKIWKQYYPDIHSD